MKTIVKRSYSYEKRNVFAYVCEAGPGECKQEAYFVKHIWFPKSCDIYACKEDDSLDLCCPTNPNYPSDPSICIGGWCA